MDDLPIVFIVDDDVSVQRAVGIVGKSLGYPIRTFSSAEEFLHGYEEGQPGCLVLDVRMPAMSGLELQRMLRAAGITLPVIMISGHADIRMAVEAMSQGACTFLEKPFRMNELTERIQSAVALSLRERNEQQERTELRTRRDALTAKEREVLDLVLDGKTNKEMARQLGLSLRTIEDRRARVMRKMGAASLVELIWAVKALGHD